MVHSGHSKLTWIFVRYLRNLYDIQKIQRYQSFPQLTMCIFCCFPNFCNIYPMRSPLQHKNKIKLLLQSLYTQCQKEQSLANFFSSHKQNFGIGHSKSTHFFKTKFDILKWFYFKILKKKRISVKIRCDICGKV